MECRIILLLTVFITFNILPSSSFSTSGIKIGIADIPNDLAAIQACRRTAYEGQNNLLSAAKSFCNADQIQREGYVCAIAKTKDGKVIGTADLNKRTGIVNNVYVVKEARKQGIGQLLMEAVEEALDKPATLKLTVYSSNKPAVNLYQKLGFTAPGIYSGLMGLSSATSINFLLEMEKKLS
jgi:ribosomal protein S18 acetylase RimI-like enzyme